MIYFLAAVETGSVNATAQKFFITPQAMNSSLKKLEQELESPLLSRDSKGVTLTLQGQLFYMYAQNIVSQYKEAVGELERFQAQKNCVIWYDFGIFSFCFGGCFYGKYNTGFYRNLS